MRILGIETSCDETSIAIVEQRSSDKSLNLLSNVVTSSLLLHAKTGGIIPETAAREQVKCILPILQEALKNADNNSSLTNPPVDAVAVTYGPGLIGSLLVGVETARVLSFVWKKPLIPVNHMLGHIYANWIDQDEVISFPALALVVSGGHTDLLLLKNHKDYRTLGGTRDDAAGEAFDKIGRLLNLPYPAGALIAKLAEKGDPKAYPFPRPMMYSKDFDFSFSGLKTAVVNEIKTMKQLNNERVADICASAQQAIIDVITYKTIAAAKKYQVKSILLGGGVAANALLRSTLMEKTQLLPQKPRLYIPPASLCTDNGAMIAACAIFHNNPVAWESIVANPQLYY